MRTGRKQMRIFAGLLALLSVLLTGCGQMEIEDRAYVLETGAITLSGIGAELAKSDEVRKAYLGG